MSTLHDQLEAAIKERLAVMCRRLRHLLGLHDWNTDATRCTWCGRSWCA